MPSPNELPIRYSASGPVIGNAEGGEAVPGEGFQLRLAEFYDSMGVLTFDGTQQDLPTINTPNFLQATLANPRPNRRYKAIAILNPQRTADGAVQCQFRFNWQVDGGAFAAGPFQPFSIGSAGVTTSFEAVVLESVMVLGSALPAPVLDGSSELVARLSVQEGSGDTIVSSATWGFIKLVEML